MERNDQEHDKHLVNFLEVCRKNTLDSETQTRCSLDFHKFSFFGHQWSARDLSPDPKKITSSEIDGTSMGYGNNEKFPRTCQLPQQAQSSFSSS